MSMKTVYSKSGGKILESSLRPNASPRLIGNCEHSQSSSTRHFLLSICGMRQSASGSRGDAIAMQLFVVTDRFQSLLIDDRPVGFGLLSACSGHKRIIDKNPTVRYNNSLSPYTERQRRLESTSGES
jgi:hypothetical protein